jgi:hypothetical protein
MSEELSGPQLDLAVARAMGLPVERLNLGDGWAVTFTDDHRGRIAALAGLPTGYCPSLRWEIGGPIIERERIEVAPCESGGWVAMNRQQTHWMGHHATTPLIAAMRAFVASKR